MWHKHRNTIGPFILMICSPVFVMLMWYTNTYLAGSFVNLMNMFGEYGLLQSIYLIWAPVFWGSPTAWTIILSFTVFQMGLMRALPGEEYVGPVTPKGNRPVYKANGVAAFFTTMLVFVACTSTGLFPATIIYDNMGELLGALNVSALTVCLLLYFKGRFAPSTTDSGTTGNFIFDYFWGTELYPQVLGWHIKKLIACRLGMMSWCLILLSYAAKQSELYGLSNSMLISVALQFIYVTKFYFWETGYLSSLDQMHDRAGWMICWGCLVFVPCIYTSPGMYLVLHPIHLNSIVALAIFTIGATSIFINYFADKQRETVRSKNGNCKIWGKEPRITVATYQTETGETRQNILLASGWWGITRHFHYIPEIVGALCWSIPALFTNFAPYFYVLFLTTLLLTRAFRDDKRCAQKYGEYWQEYCNQVPYKLVPFII